jgi:glycine cleavage system aminomethyltransferase T
MFTSRWLKDHARKGGYDVSFSNVTDELDTLGVAGPMSRDVLSKITSEDLSHEKFKFLAHKEIEIGGVLARAIRISYTGQ